MGWSLATPKRYNAPRVRIALNAELLSRSHSFRSGGISRVIRHLLVELARDPRGNSYDVFAPQAPTDDDPLGRGSSRFHVTGEPTIRPPVRILWEQLALPTLLARSRPDLLHSLAYASPLVWAGPTVLTIYDLSFLRYPDAFNRGNRLYLTAITRISARRARRVITISQHSRADIVRFLGVPPERIDVAYPAADAQYRVLPDAEVDAFRHANKLPEAFAFYLGTLEPRKNLLGLIEAYTLLSPPRVPLYVAGATGWQYSPIFERVRRLGLEHDVQFLGFVPEEALPLWYNAAQVFAYPSLYEGFGLPVLEAMACGTPVITSNVSSLPEVAGRAALLVSPDDPTGLARALETTLSDAAVRARMRAEGLIQAQRFSWSAMADSTVQSYWQAVQVAR